ncbi:EAL domain-containing protein [Rhodovastum atsumiense]|nr:EAL domain-containing protein [Rhodovastum atsumiense]CAH2602064.1 EAL domain-containing protein [Rhodovastum atsumiense]
MAESSSSALAASVRGAPPRFGAAAEQHEGDAGTRATGRHVLRAPLLVAVGFGLIIALGAGLLVAHLRHRAFETSSQELQRLSLVLADQAERAFQSVELMQSGLVERLRTAGVATPRQFREAMTGEAVHHDLQYRIRGLPQIDAVTAIDIDGNLINFSRHWPIPKVNISDRDYFKVLAADPSLMTFFGEPVSNRGSGTLTLYVARKVTGPEGQFLGLILGAVELAYFERLYATLAFGPDSTILMRRDDGRLLARFPPVDAGLGPQYASADLFRAMRATGQRSRLIRVISPVDGRERLAAYHLLQRYPLAVGTTVTVRGALAEWRKQAGYLLVATLLLEGVVLGIGLLMAHHLQSERVLAREQAARQRAEADARLGAALRSMSQGLGMFDADSRVVVTNERLRMVFGELPGGGIGMHFDDLVDAAVAQGRISPPMGEQVKAQTRASVAARRPVSYVRDQLDGRSIAVCLSPLEDGGWLVTYEDITERRRAEAQITHMAHHDALTGLPNRVLFQSRLQEALARARRGESFAVLCLDLDGFKTVNDTLGHPAGDMLLREVTGRMRREIRETDTLARLGGDEFAIIQTGAAQPEAAVALAERLIALLAEPFDLDGQHAVVGTSIGIALLPRDGEDADTALKNADLALYRAKGDGRGTFRLFEPAMDAAMQYRRTLEMDLRQALAEQQFELFYQPIMEARVAQIHSFEALLRWRHPGRGLVSPVHFVPLAEEIGLISPLGAWVLRQACIDAMQWPGHIRVAVNLSSVQFVKGDLVGHVREALAASGLPPHRLELEITETVLLHDTVATLALLEQLKGLGISIALDDFGTGYSSLSYLRKFPFDRVKIDKSFVDDVGPGSEAVAIIQAVTSLCRTLGMATTAEGVETPRQLQELQASGCTNVQGYLFSRPVPAVELPGLCRKLEQARNIA